MPIPSATMNELMANDVVFHEGDPPSKLHIVVSGKIRLTCETAEGPDVVVGYIESGAILGEMGVIDPAPRSATAVAVDDSVILCLPGDVFRELVDQGDPTARILLSAIRQMMTDRIRTLNDRIDALFLADHSEPTVVRPAAPSILERLRAIWSMVQVGG